MNYQLMGKTLENTGKEIQRLNNKLDKVLEKLLEVEALDDQKAEAIALIQADDITQAIDILKAVEKGLAKAESLKTEEATLREELKAQMQAAENALQGTAEDTPEAATASVSTLASKVA
ncbi:MAG: hypothetical protein WED11_09600 [Natronospirillum sp.]